MDYSENLVGKKKSFKPKHTNSNKKERFKHISPDLLDALREVKKAYEKFKKLEKLEQQKNPNQVHICIFDTFIFSF